MEKQENKNTVMVTCKPNGCKCNICGAFIPDGDFMCGNGHEAGERYPVTVSEKK